MQLDNIIDAEHAAARFLKAIQALNSRIKAENSNFVEFTVTGCRESGALRRASMDLTRALAKMRMAS